MEMDYTKWDQQDPLIFTSEKLGRDPIIWPLRLKHPIAQLVDHLFAFHYG